MASLMDLKAVRHANAMPVTTSTMLVPGSESQLIAARLSAVALLSVQLSAHQLNKVTVTLPSAPSRPQREGRLPPSSSPMGCETLL